MLKCYAVIDFSKNTRLFVKIAFIVRILRNMADGTKSGVGFSRHLIIYWTVNFTRGKVIDIPAEFYWLDGVIITICITTLQVEERRPCRPKWMTSLSFKMRTFCAEWWVVTAQLCDVLKIKCLVVVFCFLDVVDSVLGSETGCPETLPTSSVPPGMCMPSNFNLTFL